MGPAPNYALKRTLSCSQKLLFSCYEIVVISRQTWWVQKLKSAVDIDAAADDLPELTAKFCHAVAELEVMGYLQRGKRKGAVRLQRTLFPPPVFHS